MNIQYLGEFRKGKTFEQIYIIGRDGERSESCHFRLPKSSSQESDSVNKAIPVSTKYKNNWAMNSFAEWMQLREVKVPLSDCSGLFKDYEIHKVQALSAEMDAPSLNYWVPKFVLILWTLMIKGKYCEFVMKRKL